MNRGMEISADVADSPRSADRRAGRQRRARPDGGAVPAAGRARDEAGERIERSRRALPDHRGVRPLRRGEPADVLRRATASIAEIGAGLEPRRAAPTVDRRRPAWSLLPGPGRPAHPPARAGPRGRRDGRDRHPRPRPCGGFTAVHAMANTDPVADTAGVVEQVWRLRPAGRAGATCTRSARSRSGWRASSSPSSARWPTRRRGCGCSPTTASACTTRVLMRRALEYVKAVRRRRRPARRRSRG